MYADAFVIVIVEGLYINERFPLFTVYSNIIQYLIEHRTAIYDATSID